MSASASRPRALALVAALLLGACTVDVTLDVQADAAGQPNPDAAPPDASQIDAAPPDASQIDALSTPPCELIQ